jgi:hypothetical protein
MISRMKIIISMLAGILMLLSGCSEKPLQSLKDDYVSPKFTENFWKAEQLKNTSLWEQAKALCEDGEFKVKPNCASVHDIQMFAHPTLMPKYGSGQGFGPTTLK